MDVFAVAEGFEKNGVFGEMGQNAQLNLGVVGRQKMPLLAVDLGGNEGAPHLAAEFGADGDILEVGVAAGHAACG